MGANCVTTRTCIWKPLAGCPSIRPICALRRIFVSESQLGRYEKLTSMGLSVDCPSMSIISSDRGDTDVVTASSVPFLFLAAGGEKVPIGTDGFWGPSSFDLSRFGARCQGDEGDVYTPLRFKDGQIVMVLAGANIHGSRFSSRAWSSHRRVAARCKRYRRRPVQQSIVIGRRRRAANVAVLSTIAVSV